MFVAVETNFLLEIALQQSEAEAADSILRMAEAREIELAIPAIAFAEAYAKLAAQSKKRKVLQQDLKAEIKQMSRSRPYIELEQTSKSITDALLLSAQVHAGELARAAERLRACATVISLTREVTHDMSALKLQSQLQSGDAFICASVHRYFKEEGPGRRFFVTKDKDFQKTEEFLAQVGCELVLGFGAAIGTLRPRPS